MSQVNSLEAEMKIICFGDSNTYGYRGRDGGRYNPEQIWVNIAQQIAGEHYQFFNGGMNGRIAYNYVPPRIEADYICVMLGSNDLLCGFDFDAETIAGLAFGVIEKARNAMYTTNSSMDIFCVSIYNKNNEF